MDITTDGFGFMLAVGDLAWVPFVYSLQARYLVFNQIELGPVKTAAIIFVNLAGYYIFRSANGEKNDFRNGRNTKSTLSVFKHVHRCSWLISPCTDLQYMTTESGRKLLTSGWWGRSRHPNYMYVAFSHSSRFGPNMLCRGDLLMAFAWSLPTEFNTPITYFYVIYFAVLLIHRERRDSEACQQKCVVFGMLLRAIADASGSQVRQGLGQVQETRALAHHTICILIVCSQDWTWEM